MDNKGDYHTEKIFLDDDGQAHQINTTGHDYYYISDYKYTKNRDFYPKRLAAIKADF